MKELSYLNKYFKVYKWHLAGGLAFVILSNLFQIMPARLVREGIDLALRNLDGYGKLTDETQRQTLWNEVAAGIFWCAAAIMLVALLRGIFLYFVRQALIVMSRHIEYDLKNEIFNHYQTLPVSFYRKNNTGDLLNRISEDVSLVRMYLGPTIMYGMQLATLFAMLIPYMISISPRLSMWALAPLPALSVSIFLVNNLIMRRSEQIQKSQSRLSAIAQETFSGMRVIKSFTCEPNFAARFAEESNRYKDQSLKLTKIESLFFPLMNGLIGLSAILAVWGGSIEVIGGRLSFGNIAEFILYVNMLTWPVTSLGWTMSQLQRAEASQKRINEFLKTTSDIPDGAATASVKGKVEFKDVSFAYPQAPHLTLQNISFTLMPGDSLAVIGATGAGKTSLAQLVSRLYDASGGQILIDDRPIREYQLSPLRRQISVVPQDVFLFSDTIANNIRFGTDADDETVQRAARVASVYDNVMEFSAGFDTRVGERGVTLSGGQKQRVSIARAVVRDPAILILDDALSAIDTKTEHDVLTNLRETMKNRTTIIISHRVSSAKLANRIIVLEDGQIAESGSHKTLYAQRGIYRALYDKQLMEGAEIE